MHDDNYDIIAVPDPLKFGAPLRLGEINAPGVDPTKSTPARPGSEEKVRMLSARYAAGVALWDTRDRHDHGPEECELMGVINEFVSRR
jgi:hypothetical protein